MGTRENDMLTRAGRTRTLVPRLLVSMAIAVLFTPVPARAQAEEVVYYHTDAIGSVRAITDATGAVIERYDFLPFGEALPSTVPETRQFAGKERDAETGLDYFGARHHMSATGRFTTVDPLMNVKAALNDPQRWNRYAYGLNSPFRYVDPSGREPITVGLIVWGLYEVGSAAYDAYTAYRTLNDPSASAAERSVATGGLLAGILLPGGGYGTAAAAAVSRADDVAASAAQAVKLGRQLASDAQVAQKGRAIAGPGTDALFREAARVAKQYGGEAADWVKKTSTAFKGSDGKRFETHWVENLRTGERVELKTKLLF